VPWETAWNVSLPDQGVLLNSFNALLDAKSGNKKDEMKQEMIPDNAPPVSDE
jgi:hypothetical protein